MCYNIRMTTTERTIYMVKQLDKTEQLNVQKYIERIFEKRKNKYELKPISKKEFLKMIDRSIKQSKRGEVVSLEEFKRRSHEEYGF